MASRDTGWELERKLALVLDELVNGPFTTCSVQAVVVDLEPLETSYIFLSGIRNASTGSKVR